MSEHGHSLGGDTVELEAHVERLSYRQLKSLREKVDHVMIRRRAEALAAFEKERAALVSEYDLPDTPPSVEADYRSAIRIKYRDPETGNHWSGRGKKPEWLRDKLEAGHQLEAFAVQEDI